MDAKEIFLVSHCPHDWLYFSALFSYWDSCLSFVRKTCMWQNTCVYTFPDLPWTSRGFSAFSASQASAGNIGPPAFVNIPHWKRTLSRHVTSSTKRSANRGLKKTRGGDAAAGPASEAQSRVFVCEMCPSAFGKASALKSHINSVHLKMYRFFCDVCSKGFAVKEHCIDHTNMHNNIKAHQCPNCSRSFTFKTHLRRHLRFGVCNKYKLSSAAEKSPLAWRCVSYTVISMQNRYSWCNSFQS